MTSDLSAFRGAAGVQRAQAAVKELGERAIPTNPSNYEIWITHQIGANPDLSRAIETLIAQGKSFSDEVNEELFERYLTGGRLSNGAVEASATLARELTDVVQLMRSAGALSGAYAEELDAATRKLEASPNPDAIHEILTGIVVATRRVAARNRTFEQQLQSSSQQVEQLQTALHTARAEALTDGLTGLANRKHFESRLRSAIGEAAQGSDLCLVLCDIDHFKRVNDAWGHPAGDHVIRYVAGQLTANAKPDHFAARYGGEEFALVMSRTGLADARAAVEIIRNSVRQKTLTKRSTREELGRITLSFGIAQLRPNETPFTLTQRADACLYHSKRTGRDKITDDSEVLVETRIAS